MLNLRLYGGRVPIATGHDELPLQLVAFPSRDDFANLYGKRVKGENVERYWQMLTARAKGDSLATIAKAQGVTRERVRQIEAKFLRLMRQRHWQKPSS